MVEEQSMDKAIASTNAPQKDAGRSVIQKVMGVLGKGVRTPKQKPDDIVP